MANRYYTSQFTYSMERMLVNLMGSATQSGSTGVNASRAINGITYRAVLMGAAGNSITITLTNGGTAGAEVVTVTGTAINILMDATAVSGSSRQDIIDAIAASDEASALITATGGSATVATASTVLPLQSGATTVFTTTMKGMVMTQVDTGHYRLTLSDPYAALLACNLSIQKATAADLITQIGAVDVVTAHTIDFRTQAAGTPTNLADTDSILADVKLRNSSS